MDISVRITRDENAEFFDVEVGDVVKVPFEQYVAAVVASEIGNALIEACKAQAVAARTFAVSKGVLDGETISDASSSDQAYRASRIASGLYPNAENGAKETKDEILTYNGKPINAVYSACNGGHTVSAKERWGSDRPYLIAFDDPWDDSTKRTGHGVGMSQRGAKYAASIGMNYREILAHYYPGTQLTTIEEKEGDRLVSAKDFIDQVWIPLNENWGYIWGTWGSLWTAEKQAAATREQTVKYGAQWIGHMVTDCSGLVRWALYQLGEKDIPHHATYQYTDWCKPKGKLVDGKRTDGNPILPGTLVFLQGSEEKIHHVGVYVGDGICIEAKGTKSGVVTSQLDHWDHWGECKVVDYSKAGEIDGIVPDTKSDILFKAEVTNPRTWLNVRSGPSTAYQVQFQVQKGTVVDVLAESNGWDQIRSGGRIGWADGKYLTPLEQEEEPEEPVVPEEPDILPDDPGYDEDEEIEVRPSTIDDLQGVLQTLSDLENRVASIIRRL